MYNTDNGIPQRVTGLLAGKMGIEIPGPDTDLMESGYLDSLRFVKMLVLLEEEFDIRIAMNELEFEYFKTVDGIAAYIHQKLAFINGGIND